MIAETSMERVYNPDLVKAHPIDSKFKKTFAEILRKDYDNDTYGFSRDILGILCIEHDAWEKSLSGDDDKTLWTALRLWLSTIILITITRITVIS